MKENELEFSDWPMFDLLMTNEELCRELLEVVLNAPVSNIEYIIAENDIRPTLTNHGVRLDAYVKTENEVCNIEMQTVKRAKLGRRLRFYQGAMDTLALRRGEHYGNLPPCYIVFICLHDPFNAGLPVYTLNVKCQENTSVKTDHGFTWIVLAAPAWDRLPPGRLRNLLHYISTGEAGDDRFATKLAAAVRAANGDEAWRKEKMALLTFEEDMEIQRRMLEEDREDFEIQKRILEEDRGDFEIQKRTLEEQQRALEEDLEKQKHALEEQKRVLEEQRRMLQEDLDKQEHIAVEAAESEGRTEGLEAGEARLGALIAALIESGRSEEVALVATDADARRARFEEFGL
ncbi:Rpn family recombination-promoting nuclease/putative transposase [Adlercreutzia sp. DFI.6.23]|jgi:predicted transposase/invertase (TIGR01784 family)|uniref:Rpn family recombination-promoting nuclease/putative transposase n=1 Tax=Adlercreutzia sp. DFI.6.23 TaxID=2963705 RepID=UPI00210E88F5|nr:Rpn family recombination-promoting nuclease/putative transposase [Adlercreutzia sp. DFI.6.23]MCQ5069466.1 Rpn family recombination-promoting nuclease/putative transposase [Adlercreutzia sp. DFI.6.23]